MNSKRIGAITELKRRLAAIERPAFSTDAGKNVFVGEVVSLGHHDPETAIAIVIGDSTETHRGLSDVVEGNSVVAIQAIVKAAPADRADPFLMAEDVIADIKRAVELEDRSLDGWCLSTGFARAAIRPARRMEGSEYVGAAVEYALAVEERWGHP